MNVLPDAGARLDQRRSPSPARVAPSGVNDRATKVCTAAERRCLLSPELARTPDLGYSVQNPGLSDGCSGCPGDTTGLGIIYAFSMTKTSPG